MGRFERYRYPANWDEMSKACKDRAGWRCQRQQCGAAHGDLRIGLVSGKEYTVVIAACHVNHDPENPDAQLISLCQACHMKLDGLQHARTRRRRERAEFIEMQRAAGQLEMPLLTLEKRNGHEEDTNEAHRNKEKRRNLIVNLRISG